MEGYLERRKKTLGIHLWTRVYAVLKGNVLTLLGEREREVLGQIHMQIALFDIVRAPATPGFSVTTGLKTEVFRTDSAETAEKWVSAMRLSKANVSSEARRIEAMRSAISTRQPLTDPELQKITDETYIDRLKDKVSIVCELQAILAQQLSQPVLTDTAIAREVCEKLRRGILDTLTSVEEVYTNQAILRSHLATRLAAPTLASPVDRFSHGHGTPGLSSALEDTQPDTRPSPADEYNGEVRDERSPRPKRSFEDSDERQTPIKIESKKFFEQPVSLKKVPNPEPTVATSPPRSVNSEVGKIIANNPVFVARPVLPSQPAVRDSLPSRREPGDKLNIWKLLKNNIGRDLTRVTLPVSMNEPISLTQKVFCLMEFEWLLQKALAAENSGLRAAYLLAMNMGILTISAFSTKKPFNSLLGETFDLVTPTFRAVSEQVVHHPPITAYFVEAADYEIEGSFTVNVNFTFSGMEIALKGAQVITLKKLNERWTLTRPKGSAHNYVWGKPYTWFNAESAVENRATGERAFVAFRPRTNIPDRDFEVEGAVLDAQKNVKYRLFGNWNSGLSLEDPRTGAVTVLFRRSPDVPDQEQQYFFSKFMVNLNNLTPAMLPSLPYTDSRLRPDLRAFEYGLEDLAESEKRRLEDAQRARRKANEKVGQEHCPLWFEVSKVEKEYTVRFLRKYFQAKDSGNWPELPHIFSD